MSDAEKERAQLSQWIRKVASINPAGLSDTWIDAATAGWKTRASLDRSGQPCPCQKLHLIHCNFQDQPIGGPGCICNPGPILTREHDRRAELDQCHEILDSTFADHALESACAKCRDHSVGYRAARLIELLEQRSERLEEALRRVWPTLEHAPHTRTGEGGVTEHNPINCTRCIVESALAARTRLEER